METWAKLAIIGAAYLLGGFSPGYWLVRWRTGTDIRSSGSGGTGATNTARILGRGGFTIVFLLDLAKGAAAVGAAKWFGELSFWLHLVVLSVVAGHIWPVQLNFRGGKGISTLLGALLIYDPVALAPSLLVACVVLGILRRFTISGLCGLLVLPITIWWFEHDWNNVAITTVTLGIVLFAHREHLQRWFGPAENKNT